MADERAHLAHADRHIAVAKNLIDQQQQLIERLAANGHSVGAAESFLSALMDILSAFEHHRLAILNRLRP